MTIGKTIGLFGDSGSGKTTQGGEYAKWIRKNRSRNTLLHTCDSGGYDSIGPLVRAGVVKVDELGQGDDPWIWLNDASEGLKLTDDIGLVIIDSGTSAGERLLQAASHSDFQVGQQKTQRFKVNQGDKSLQVSINNEAHFGVVQSFLLDAIWKSTWLTRKGVDVLWTFATHRSEEQDRTPILGAKLAGKALTPFIPKWFKYFWRIVSLPQEGQQPVHRLYLAEYPELAGMGHSFGNSRTPLDADPLPPWIEPASIITALDLIESAQKQADERLAAELGL